MSVKRTTSAEILVPVSAPPAEESRLADVVPLRAPAPMPALVALHVTGFDEETGRATLRLGSGTVEARLDPAVDPIVVRTAVDRGERLIAQAEADGHVVLGALRTAPTPGIDAGDEYVIEARRIAVRGTHEVSLI